jgi:hypothetical protein
MPAFQFGSWQKTPLLPMYTYLTIHSKRPLPDASAFVAGNRLLIRANHALLVQSAEFRFPPRSSGRE